MDFQLNKSWEEEFREYKNFLTDHPKAAVVEVKYPHRLEWYHVDGKQIVGAVLDTKKNFLYLIQNLKFH